MKFNKYTKEQLINAVATSISKRETLQKLNVSACGGQYQVLDKAIKELNLDTSHFKGQGWNAGTIQGPKRGLNEYLDNSQTITSHKLRLRLIEENVKDHKCECCQLTVWNEKPIPLELEHIDGNHNNNKLDNLKLLCPNCHAQTPTYRRSKSSLS